MMVIDLKTFHYVSGEDRQRQQSPVLSEHPAVCVTDTAVLVSGLNLF